MSAGTPLTPPGPALLRRDQLARRIRLLVDATIAYNVVEAVVALTAGTAASSNALIGFGLDSVVEVSSAAVAWQFATADHAVREAGRPGRRGSSPSRSSPWRSTWPWIPYVLSSGPAIAAVAVKEGRDAWRGQRYCAPTSVAVPPVEAEVDPCGCRAGRACCV